MTWIHFLQMAVVGSFALAVAGNLLVQRRRGIRALVLSSKPGARFVEILALLLLTAWCGVIALEGLPVLEGRLGPTLLDGPVVDGLGALLMSSGLVLGLVAYVHMGRSWRIGIDEGSFEELVTHGVFRLSRNPIYLFIDLLGVGVLLASGSLFYGVSVPLVLLGVHFKILEEERFLKRKHRAEFEAYSRQTPRYFGLGARFSGSR